MRHYFLNISETNKKLNHESITRLTLSKDYIYCSQHYTTPF